MILSSFIINANGDTILPNPAPVQQQRLACPEGQLKVNVNDDSPDAPSTYACIPGALPDCSGLIAGKCPLGHACVNSAQPNTPATHSCVAVCEGTQTGVCKRNRTCVNSAPAGQPPSYSCEKSQPQVVSNVPVVTTGNEGTTDTK